MPQSCGWFRSRFLWVRCFFLNYGQFVCVVVSFFVCVYFVLCFLIVLSLVGNTSAVDYLGRLFYWGPVVCIKWHVSSHCGEASCKLVRVYSVNFSYFIIKWDFITLFTHAKSTHTHPFNVPYPGLPRWAGTRKAKPICILLKQETVSGSGISCAICKSAPRSRHNYASTPPLSFLHAGCPSWRPTNSVKALKAICRKHWR